MQQYEYLVVDNGFMTTNRSGYQSMKDETYLSNKLTSDFGSQGWKLVGILGEDFIFVRPLPEQIEETQKSMEKSSKTTRKKLDQ